VLFVATTPRDGRVPIDGASVRNLRERRFAWTRTELAQKIGKSESAVQAIERGETPSVYSKTFRSLAEAFGMTLEEAKTELSPKATWDQNVDMSSIQPVEDVPEFKLGICCGGWADVTELGVVDATKLGKVKRFRVYCDGDSMEPRFPTGSIVEFVKLDPLNDRLKVGRAYYVQVGSEATLKELVKVDRGRLIFRAINVAKYPDQIVVNAREVVNLARAEYLIQRLL
jgi:phage repressor protein C with HTH and peptisase S24 domain